MLHDPRSEQWKAWVRAATRLDPWVALQVGQAIALAVLIGLVIHAHQRVRRAERTVVVLSQHVSAQTSVLVAQEEQARHISVSLAALQAIQAEQARHISESLAVLQASQAEQTRHIDALAPAVATIVEKSVPKVVASRDALLRAYTAEPIELQRLDDSPAVLDHDASAGFRDLTGKREIACPKSADGRVAVLLIAGQSMVTNDMDVKAVASNGVVNLNVYDGKCYAAADPLLGTSGFGGNVMTRVGSALMQTGRHDQVVLVPVAIGGTYARQWTPYGTLHRRLLVAIERARRAGLRITHVLWDQGQADIAIANSELYRRQIEDIWLSLRQYGVYAPILVARSSRCGNDNPNISTAQTQLADPRRGIFAGADTNAIGDDERHDGCHLGAAGAERLAADWARAIAEHW
jgi:hypothetical protein